MPTIEQLKAEYDGEWLAINVTASDKFGATEGELLCHTRDRDGIWRKIKEIPRYKRKDYDLAVLYAGPLVSEGMAIAISVWATPEQMARLSSKTQE